LRNQLAADRPSARAGSRSALSRRGGARSRDHKGREALPWTDPPAADVLARFAERDAREAMDDRTEAQIWLGEPPYAQSALAKRDRAPKPSSKPRLSPLAPTISRAKFTDHRLVPIWADPDWQSRGIYAARRALPHPSGPHSEQSEVA